MTFTTCEEVTSAIKQCITSEMVEDGLLSDVESFVPSYRLDEPIDLPTVWLFEHPTTQKGKMGFTEVIKLTTPFEFVCVCFDDDLEKAEIQGKNLAWRVFKTLFKNKMLIVEGKRVFDDITFQTLYPVGEVQIQGKMNRIPATSVVLEFTYSVESIPQTPTEKIKHIRTCDVTTHVVSEYEYQKDKKGGH